MFLSLNQLPITLQEVCDRTPSGDVYFFAGKFIKPENIKIIFTEEPVQLKPDTQRLIDAEIKLHERRRQKYEASIEARKTSDEVNDLFNKPLYDGSKASLHPKDAVLQLEDEVLCAKLIMNDSSYFAHRVTDQLSEHEHDKSWAVGNCGPLIFPGGYLVYEVRATHMSEGGLQNTLGGMPKAKEDLTVNFRDEISQEAGINFDDFVVSGLYGIVIPRNKQGYLTHPDAIYLAKASVQLDEVYDIKENRLYPKNIRSTDGESKLRFVKWHPDEVRRLINTGEWTLPGRASLILAVKHEFGVDLRK